jgi:hypothetical protein
MDLSQFRQDLAFLLDELVPDPRGIPNLSSAFIQIH